MQLPGKKVRLRLPCLGLLLFPLCLSVHFFSSLIGGLVRVDRVRITARQCALNLTILTLNGHAGYEAGVKLFHIISYLNAGFGSDYLS